VPAQTALIGMALVALGMVLIPGPNMMYLVSRSVSQGYRAGLFSLIGTGTGFVIYMVMANVGMAEVFLIVPWLYIGLKLCGAGYLLYLSWRTLRPGGVALFEERTPPRDSRAKLFRMGLMTNLLNPKAASCISRSFRSSSDQTLGTSCCRGSCSAPCRSRSA
jgi:threonine/homoserine/homoserine lactone efflux protein